MCCNMLYKVRMDRANLRNRKVAQHALAKVVSSKVIPRPVAVSPRFCVQNHERYARFRYRCPRAAFYEIVDILRPDASC
jgi:hypothetical protein